MSEKWLIAVTAGRWQASSIAIAKQMGIKVIAIDSDPNAAGLAFADIQIVAELTDFDGIVKQIKGHNIAGVLSICCDAGMLLAGQLREYFAVETGPDIKVSQHLTNKKLQRQAWKNKDIDRLNWFTVKAIDSVPEIFERMPLPFIIKPVDSAGSRGVFKVENVKQPIVEYIEQAFSFSPTREVIVESFMAGREYTVEGFVDNGICEVLAITEKDKIESANNLVAYKLQTAQLSAEMMSQVEQLVKSSVVSVSYKNGPIHAEVIIMKDGSVGMVELAGRGGGFMVYEAFVKAQSGFDIVKNTIKQAVGWPTDKIVKQQNHTILRFFPTRQGRVTQIAGIDAADNVAGISAGAFVSVGDELGWPKSDGDRMGFYLCHAKTKDAALKLAEQAESLIRFDVEERDVVGG